MILELIGAENYQAQRSANGVGYNYEIEHMSAKRRKKKEERKKKREERKDKAGNFLNIISPFRGLMVAALKKKGVKHRNNIFSISKAFYHSIILKEHYQAGAYEIEHLVEEAAEGIVKAIIEFFKGLKNKQESGAEMSEEELKLLAAGEVVSKQVDNVKDEEVTSGIGEMFQKYWWVALLIVIAILAYGKMK